MTTDSAPVPAAGAVTVEPAAPSDQATSAPARATPTSAGKGTSAAKDGMTALFRDAVALASSSVLTAGLGIAFWALCARLLPPERLGVQTALMALVTAPAIIVGTGMGDALTSLVPASRSRLRVLVRAYRVVAAAALGAAVLAGTAAATALPDTRGDLVASLSVGVGVLVWTFFTVQDSALTSLGRAGWLPWKNAAASLSKVGLLPLLLALDVGHPVVVATVLPAGLAVLLLLRPVVRRGRQLDSAAAAVPTPRSPGVEELPALARRTTLSVALSMGALTLLPFAVTLVVGPEQGAVFAVSLAIVTNLDFLAAALGVSLVVHGASDAARAGAMARMVLRRSLMLVVPAAVGLVALSPLALAVVAPDYRELGALPVIAVLATGSVVRVAFATWSALQRSRRDITPVLWLNGSAVVVLYASLPLVAGPAGADTGALGAAFCLLLAQVVLTAGACAHTVHRRLRRRANGAEPALEAVG